jgi:hypothetical protein
MGTLNISEMTFSRGEDGNLIPQEAELESLPNKPKVKIKPLTRGKLQEIYAKATSGDNTEKIQADNDVIKNGLVEPVLNDQQLEDLKPQYAAAITTAILSISLGIEQKEVQDKAQQMISEQELELKKK